MRSDNIVNKMISTTVGGSEDTQVLDVLYPTKGPRHRMLSEISPDLVYGMTVLSMFRRKYKSKNLNMFEEEFCTWQTAKDRKGKLEAVEVTLSTRRSSMSDED